jgi:hypothetical protein
LATSTTASLAFALASQPERLSAQAASTETSGSGGGSANNVNYAGYLKSDPADGQKRYDGMGWFYQPIDVAPAITPTIVSPNGYNPQNLNPPPSVRIDVVEAHVVIIATGPPISGRPGPPDYAPEKNLINESKFDIFPAVLVRYTQTPIVGGIPQTNYTSPVKTDFKSLMPSDQWPGGATKVNFKVTPPVWEGSPTELNETRGPNSISMGFGSGQTAPSGSSFDVTGIMGQICRLTAHWTLAADQKFTSFHLGQVGFGLITIPPNVYKATFEWKFGILKWNLSTGHWDVQS